MAAGDPVPGMPPGNFYNEYGGIYQVGLPATTEAWFQDTQIAPVSESFATAAEAQAAYVPAPAAPGPAPIGYVPPPPTVMGLPAAVPITPTIPDHPNATAHDGQETTAQTVLRQITGVDTRETTVKPPPAPDITGPVPVTTGTVHLPSDAKPNLLIPAAALAAWWLVL